MISFDPVRTAKLRIGFAMEGEHSEYALFEGGTLRAEIVYDAATGDNVSLLYDHTLERMIEAWSFNGAPSYGAKGKIAVGCRNLLFRAYTLASRYACVGFDYQWDSPSNDPDNWPGKIMFGYFCKKKAGALDQGEIDALINSLDPEGAVDGSASLPKAGGKSVDAAAMHAGKAANKKFPFNFGQEFSENTWN